MQVCAIQNYSKHLNGFSKIRSTKQGQHSETYEQVIRRVGDHTGNQTPRPFIDPRPEKPAPKNADEPDQAISVGQRKETGAHDGSGKEFEPTAEHSEE